MKRYRIYPSLLDSFQRWLMAEVDAESYTNIDADGNYIHTVDELSDMRYQELLNAINRVPFTSDVVERGQAFNDVIDSVLGNHKDNVQIDETICSADINGRTYRFGSELVKSASRYLMSGLTQVYGQRLMRLSATEEVILYGYADYVLRDKIIDLKTTSRYYFGKYELGWQRFVYPYVLAPMMHVSSFIYLSVELRSKDNIFFGSMHPEEYTISTADESQLRDILGRFVSFLEMNKDKITDNKIFDYER